jgi:hypothetical protein
VTIASRLAKVEARLLVVEAKIEECENAQSYGIAGRTVTKVAYAELQKEYRALRAERAKLLRGGSSVTNPAFPSAS